MNQQKKNIAVLVIFGLIVVAVIGFLVYAFIQIDTSKAKVRTNVSYEQIYNDFQENPISAGEKYNNHTYLVTGEVVKIDKAGVTEVFVGYNVDVKIEVGGQTVYAYGNFESEDDILDLEVGDTITFSGECISESIWYKCKIVE